ncbi:MAG: OmpA family protein [Bacteroidetes bacterium]|nr:OmpA family protein [Bacteroidota bacterium]
MHRLIRRTAVLVLLALIVPFGGASAQNIDDEVEALNTRMEDARSNHLNLIAPRAFREARDQLNDAREMLREGDKIADIREAVQEGQASLNEAMKLQDIGNVILEDAIAARSDALAARAPEFATEQWREAQDVMEDAGREIEKGDQNDARDQAREATQLYRRAELTAIRADVLGRAREARSAARSAEAEEWASKTYQDAESKLQEAESRLQGDRYGRASAREVAEAATDQFVHARDISREAQQVDDDVEENFEDARLTIEQEVARVASELNRDVSFAEGFGPVADELVAAVQSLNADRENLQESLADRQREIRRLLARVDSMDARLAELEEREQEVTAELQQRQERERTLRRARGVFGEDEAEVSLRGDEMIVRMYGLNFPVGSSEIRPANFSLLTKLQQVLREFPDAPITIEGHTDSRGNDATNQRLSDERATAVQEYLMANMSSLSSDQVDAVGYGESRPLASNETEEGRAQNRRIDVTISLP